MIKASLPYLGIPERRAIFPFVKAQELRRTMELFEAEEVISVGICSLDRPQGKSSLRDLLKTVRPYGNPMEQDIIDMTEALVEDQTPMGQLRRFLTPKQQSRFETMEMISIAIQTMA